MATALQMRQNELNTELWIQMAVLGDNYDHSIKSGTNVQRRTHTKYRCIIL